MNTCLSWLLLTSCVCSAATPYPRIAMLWSPVRGDRSVEGMARHDLIMTGVGGFGLRYDREPTGLAEGFTTDSVERARQRLAELRALKPNAPILAELYFYEYRETWLPEDHHNRLGTPVGRFLRKSQNCACSLYSCRAIS